MEGIELRVYDVGAIWLQTWMLYSCLIGMTMKSLIIKFIFGLVLGDYTYVFKQVMFSANGWWLISSNKNWKLKHTDRDKWGEYYMNAEYRLEVGTLEGSYYLLEESLLISAKSMMNAYIAP